MGMFSSIILYIKLSIKVHSYISIFMPIPFFVAFSTALETDTTS